MTDLDFDELDRAVSSLMKDKKEVIAQNDETPVATETQVEGIPSVDVADHTVDTPNQETIDISPATNQSVIVKKQPSSGSRYMDMKPSIRAADKAKDLFTHSATGLSTGATKIDMYTSGGGTPFHDIVPPVAGINNLSGQSSLPSESNVGETTPVVEKQAAAGTVLVQEAAPSISEYQNTTVANSALEANEVIAPEPVISDDQQPRITDDLDAILSNDGIEPVVDSTEKVPSPFIADAKIEKRPLGSSSQLQEFGTDSSIKSGSDNESQQQVENGSVAQVEPVPDVTLPEFHEDLLVVEADSNQFTKQPQSESTEKQVEMTPVETVRVGPVSISQQYKESANTGDASHTPLYDTNTNLQPLAHPARKKSGWGIVLWIVIIIILCVLIAAGLYFAGIIELPL